MTFDRPDLLVLGPFAALLFAVALVLRFRRLRRLAQAYGGTTLARLLPVGSGHFPSGRLIALVASGMALGLAAAGPGWEMGDGQPRPPLDVAIAVDLSLSMTATDAPPTRIARAREAIARLGEELPSVRFSMVMFAAWPHVILPPTDDPELVGFFAQSLSADLVGARDRGTGVAEALYWAGTALDERPRENARRVVLLFSDGGDEAAESALEAARWLDSTNVEVWVAATGSAQGSAIFAEGTPLLDAGGQPVIAALDEELLRGLAEAAGGRYFNVSDAAGLDALLSDLRELSGDREGAPPPPIDAAFLLVLAVVPLLLWEGAVDAGRLTPRARGEEART